VSSSVDDIKLSRANHYDDIVSIDKKTDDIESRVKISKPSNLASFISEQRRKMKPSMEMEDCAPSGLDGMSDGSKNALQVVGEDRNGVVSSCDDAKEGLYEAKVATNVSQDQHRARRPSGGSDADVSSAPVDGSVEPARRPSLTKMITNFFAPKDKKICPMSPQKPNDAPGGIDDERVSPNEFEADNVAHSEPIEISEVGNAQVDLDASLEMDAMLDAMRLVLTDLHVNDHHKHDKKRSSPEKDHLGTIFEVSAELNSSMREEASKTLIPSNPAEFEVHSPDEVKDEDEDRSVVDDDETFEESSLSSFPSIDEEGDLGEFGDDDWGEGNDTFGGGYTGVNAQEQIQIEYSTNEMEEDAVIVGSSNPIDSEDAPTAMSLRGDFDAEDLPRSAASPTEESEAADTNVDSLAPLSVQSHIRGGGKGRAAAEGGGVHIDLSASIRRDVIVNIRVSLEQRLGRRRFQRAYNYLRDLKVRMQSEADEAQSDQDDEKMLADMEAILGEDGLKYLDTMYQLITSEDEF
jgi:hypothetical protein